MAVIAAVVGTVGVPARYGGFETLAEQLARHVSPGSVRFVIYCQRSAYPGESGSEGFAGHERVFLPLRANGIQSMVHDAIAMCHALFVRRVEVLLVLGYSGAWFLPLVRLLRPRLRVVINVDGMEWRREKFGRLARKVLRGLEAIAVRNADAVITDNDVLQGMLLNAYGRISAMIPYGGDHTVRSVKAVAGPGYFLSVARVEPENNVGTILEAFQIAGQRLVFVGNWSASEYGRELWEKYSDSAVVHLMPPEYDLGALAVLRAGAIGYVHGHSVGGTNPSLVEALFHTGCVVAFDCSFNRATLDGDGQYFGDRESLVRLISCQPLARIPEERLLLLRQRYRWSTVASAYERILTE